MLSFVKWKVYNFKVMLEAVTCYTLKRTSFMNPGIVSDLGGGMTGRQVEDPAIQPNAHGLQILTIHRQSKWNIISQAFHHPILNQPTIYPLYKYAVKIEY